MSSNRYVPRSIQNIFDRLEARNERSDKESFSTELPKVFQVIVYDSATPEVRSPTTQTNASSADNFYKYRARSLAGHNDLIPAAETAKFRGQYERLRNAHFQAIVRKDLEGDQLPLTGETWMATHLGGNLVELTGRVRSSTFTLRFQDGNGAAQNAHTNGQNPTTTVAATSGATQFVGPPAPGQITNDIESASDITTHYPKVEADFANKIVEVANNLGTNAYWLANLINFETAATFNPAIQNSLGYTGLIQFGDGAATDLGTTTSHLKTLSAIEQMDFVQKYFELPHKRKGSNYGTTADLYMAVFYPAAVGKSLDFNIAEHWASKDRRGRPASYFSSAAVNPGIVTVRDYVTKANNNAKLPTGM